MSIHCDKGVRKFWVLQEKYIKKVLERFNMKDAKLLSFPLGSHFKLIKNLSENKKEEMEKCSLCFSGR